MRDPLLVPEKGGEEEGKVNQKWGLGSSSITAMGTKNSGTRIRRHITTEEEEEEEEMQLNESFLILPLQTSSRE